MILPLPPGEGRGEGLSLMADPHPSRATSWQLRTTTLSFGPLPALMGIVNVTPDSFSDGGRFFAQDAAVDQALRLVAEGADILDIGGESTRPNAEPVPAEEELRRVVPVIERLAAETKVPLSIDTSKASVAEAAITAGVEIINDVTGLEGDPAMLALAATSGAGICAMHMRGTPQTMQDDPQYKNVVDEILEYLRRRRDALLAAGISPARICLDPGIGFGKTHRHNLALVTHFEKFHALGCPLLAGHSRKGFVANIIGDKTADRTAGTIGVSLALARAGAQILRVHDIAATRQALLMFHACGGLK